MYRNFLLILIFIFCQYSFCEVRPFFRVSHKELQISGLELVGVDGNERSSGFTLKTIAGDQGIPLSEIFAIKGIRFPDLQHEGLVGLRFSLFIPSELPDAELVFLYSSSRVNSSPAQLFSSDLPRDSWVDVMVWLPFFKSAVQDCSIFFAFDTNDSYFYSSYSQYRNMAQEVESGARYSLIDETRRELFNADTRRFCNQVLLRSLELVFPKPLSDKEYLCKVQALSSLPFETVIINVFFMLSGVVILFPFLFMRKYLSMRILLLLFLPVWPLLLVLALRAHEFVRSLDESTMQAVSDELQDVFAGLQQISARTERDVEEKVHSAIEELHKLFLESQDDSGNSLFRIRHLQWVDNWESAVMALQRGESGAQERLTGLAAEAAKRFLPYCQRSRYGRCVEPEDAMEMPPFKSQEWESWARDIFLCSRESNAVAAFRDQIYRETLLSFVCFDGEESLDGVTSGLPMLMMNQLFREGEIKPEGLPELVSSSREKFAEISEILQFGGMEAVLINHFLDRAQIFHNLTPMQKGGRYSEEAWAIRPSKGGHKSILFFIRSKKFLFGKMLYKNMESFFRGRRDDYFVMGGLRVFDFPVRNFNHSLLLCGTCLVAENEAASHFILSAENGDLFAVYGAPMAQMNPYLAVIGCNIHQDFIALRGKKLMYMLIGFLLLVAFGVMAFLISQHIRAPLSQLAVGMDRIRQRKYNCEVSVSSVDEFSDLAGVCNNLRFSLQEKERLTGFLAEEALSSIADNEFCTSREMVSVLFCGVLNGTDYKNLDFSLKFKVFNAFLVCAQENIFQANGAVDKFTGNACLGFFRGESVFNCPLAAAVAIRQELTRINEKFSGEGILPLKVGIGIATGDVVLGYIGAEKRRDFTSIGNTVNTAARLETFAKNSVENTAVFLDGDTFRNHVRNDGKAGDFNFIAHSGVVLKGKHGKQVIYELL